eukprot:1269328-Heterocapsa_arctica.AAC.1
MPKMRLKAHACRDSRKSGGELERPLLSTPRAAMESMKTTTRLSQLARARARCRIRPTAVRSSWI